MTENNNNKKNDKINKIKKIKIDDKEESIRICKYCNVEKPIELFAVSQTKNLKIYRKFQCLECQKIKSKEYYDNYKEKVLKKIKDKYEKEQKKHYTYIIKFNNINDIDIEVNKLKENFNNGLIEMKKPNKIKKNKIDNENNLIENIVDNVINKEEDNNN